MKTVLRLRRALASMALTVPRTRTAKTLFPSLGAVSRTPLKMAAMLMMFLLLMAEGARAQSSLDGFDPGANNTVRALAVQADGKILVGGEFDTLGGGGTGTTTRHNIGRLNPDGTLDTSFDPGASGFVNALAVQADGKILVGGDFTTLGGGGFGTTTRNFIGRLNPDGTLDTSFDPGATQSVRSLVVQADGKILVGGDFTTLGGGGFGTTTRFHIGRLNPDGTLDTSFDPGANNTILALVVQADGKILVGGPFSALGGAGTTSRNKIGRLNPDGTLDTNFDPGANDDINALAVQADGKILVGGSFSTLGGGGTGTTTRNKIGRLNADGILDSSFDPGADQAVLALAVQSDGRILVDGAFTTLGGGGTGMNPRSDIGRLNPDGTLDTSFDPGANNFLDTLAVQPDGKVLVGGAFTTLGGGGTGTITRNFIGRLYPDGTLDLDFNPGADNSVNALALQPDNKILIGGFFTALGGGTGTTQRNRIGRVTPDGILDSFNPSADDNSVNSLWVQADGKVLAGGAFTSVSGQTHNRIARLTPDGLLDPGFSLAAGADNLVRVVPVQEDGNILVGGTYQNLNGQPRNRIGRLLPDGTLDSFNPDANGPVRTVALQPDNQIIIAGQFTQLSGQPRNFIGRVSQDGVILDPNFDPNPDNFVLAVAIQSDDNIIIAGDFTNVSGQPHNHIARLTSDGTLDPTFNPDADNTVRTLAVQTDGNILVGGLFTLLNTQIRNSIGRLTPDGNLDATFDPGTDDPTDKEVFGLTIQPDGKVLAGGAFTFLGDGGTTPRSHIGRLTNTDAALQALSVDATGAVITWERSGAAPEVRRVTFELSTDGGLTYIPLSPDPTRIPGGWQLTGQSLPILQNIFIRARGFYPSAREDGSGSILETVRNAFITPAPVINSPLSATATVGQPFTYQISATNSPTTFNATGLPSGLTVDTGTGVISGTPSAIGTFSVALSATNAGGTGTATLTLTVNPSPPVITSSLSATATVGQPFSYQITATNNPTSFDATGLPAPLTVNTSSGLISGTPSAAGVFSVGLSATNAGGTGTATLTLTINLPPPVITSSLSAAATVGQPFSYQITATNNPTSFDATGLPAPLTVNTSAGSISGTPSTTGVFSVILSATNAGGTGTATLTLTIDPTPPLPPVITSPNSATATVGQPFTYQIVASNSPTSYDATPLPAGLSVNQVVPGVISGTPTAVGTTAVKLNASNAGGTDTAPLTLTVQPAPVSQISIVSPSSVTGRTSQPFTFQVITTGASSSARLSATGLSPGLSLDPITGLISGTATADGSSPVVLTVIDGNLRATGTLELTFTSDLAVPVIVSASSVPFVPGQFFKYTIMAPTADQNDPVTYSLIGTLPTGLTLNRVTGVISGIPRVAASLLPAPPVAGGVITNVQLFATNSHGTGTIPLVFFLPPSGALNISTRLNVGTGNNVLIGGFILTGNAPKKLIIRSLGPELIAKGVTGVLADPVLALHGSVGGKDVVLVSNGNWKDTQEAEILATGVAPSNDREAAIVATLDSNNNAYTAIVSGKNKTSGVATVEVYDLGTAAFDNSSEAQLANISTRGYLQAGENNVMIAGLIVGGSAPSSVLLRAIGPSLALPPNNISDPLLDPTLDLLDANAMIIATNDDWQTAPNKQDIINTGIPPKDSHESAILKNLAPGEYTAILRGKNDAVGVAVVEAYFLP